MTLGQTYYTSCERGLSGSVGYQFNAVSPDLSPEILREIEGLSGYDPPDRVGGSPSDEVIAAAPVSLVHRPGEPTIIANVVYTGADFSKRYGNFFSHALVALAPGALDGVFPIELWGSPAWVKDESPSVDLPPLMEVPPAGPLNRESVAAFIAGHQRGAWLDAMVSAAARTITSGERSVVIVEDSSDAVAHWIAAISYLLPPPLAEAMSFTTYNYRPSYSDLHVIGTLADTLVETGDRAGSQLYFLFDVPGNQVSPLDVHPVVRLVLGRGLSASRGLWNTVLALHKGDERDLDAWHPAVTAAVVTLHGTVDRNDLDVGIPWLAANAARLGTEITGDVGEAFRGQALNPTDLALLVEAGRAAGALSLLSHCEEQLAGAHLDAVADRRAWEGPPYVLTSAEALAAVAARCDEVLAHAEPDLVFALIDWAFTTGIHIDEGRLAGLGAGLLGPSLVDARPTPFQVAAVGHYPPLLDGVAVYAAARAREDPAAALAAFDAGLGALLGRPALDAHVELQELEMISDARLHPDRRVEVLERMVALREASAEVDVRVDSELLMTLWPEGTIGFGDLGRMLLVFSEHQVIGGDLPAWISRAIATADTLTPELWRLCEVVRGHAVLTALSAQAQACLQSVSQVARDLAALERAPDGDRARLLIELLKRSRTTSGPGLATLAEQLPPLMADLDVDDLARAIHHGAPVIGEAYLAQITPALRDGDTELAARLWIVRRRFVRSEGPWGPKLEALLRRYLMHWKKRSLRQLNSELEAYAPNDRIAFDQWLNETEPAGETKKPRWRRDDADQ